MNATLSPTCSRSLAIAVAAGVARCRRRGQGAVKLQAAELFFTLQFRTPFAVVRQHVTAPERPQVEFAAHFLTVPPQELGSVPAFTASLTTRAAHFTYLRRLGARVQGAAIIARTAAAAEASLQPATPRGSVVLVVAEQALMAASNSAFVGVPRPDSRVSRA
jgi:hypothetical protein